MDKVKELIQLLGTKDVIARTPVAKAHGICKICGKSALFFRTPRAEMEYNISSICQSCQDYFIPIEQ